MREPHGGVGHDAEIASQIVRCLAPEVGALFFQFLDVGQSALEIPDMARGLLLLKLEVSEQGVVVVRWVVDDSSEPELSRCCSNA